MAAFTMDELVEACQTLDRFLQALIAGDDETVLRLLYPASAYGLSGDAESIAQRFKDAWGVTDDDVRGFGLGTTARILDGEFVAFAMIDAKRRRRHPMSDIELVTEPTPARVLALTRADDDSGWQLWGTPSPEEFANPIERVPLILPTSGPMH